MSATEIIENANGSAAKQGTSRPRLAQVSVLFRCQVKGLVSTADDRHEWKSVFGGWGSLVEKDVRFVERV
jgi:hypothetical protein